MPSLHARYRRRPGTPWLGEAGVDDQAPDQHLLDDGAGQESSNGYEEDQLADLELDDALETGDT